MRVNYLIVSLVGFAFVATASAQQPAVSNQPSSRVTREDAPDTSHAKSVTPETFAVQAAQISAAGIELGRPALDRAQSPQVRQYAQKMIGEHSEQNEKLARVATQQHIALPSALAPEHQALKQKLSGLRGGAVRSGICESNEIKS